MFKSLVFSLLFLACSPILDHSEPLIIGGRGLEPSDPGFASVVGFVPHKNSSIHESFCTGTLIADKLILTAAHCEVSNHDFVIVEDLTQLGTFETVAIESFMAHPYYHILGEQSVFDVAWVKLKEELPRGYIPAKIPPNLSFLNEGEQIFFVGLGADSDSGDVTGERLIVESTVRSVPRTRLQGERIYSGPTPRQGTCPGDSGGPAWVNRSGEWYLIGSLTGGFSECENGESIHQSAPYFKSWISESSGVTLPGESSSTMLEVGLDPRHSASFDFEKICTESLVSLSWYQYFLVLADLFETQSLLTGSLPKGHSCESIVKHRHESSAFESIDVLYLRFSVDAQFFALLEEHIPQYQSVGVVHVENLDSEDFKGGRELATFLHAAAKDMPQLKRVTVKNVDLGLKEFRKLYPHIQWRERQ